MDDNNFKNVLCELLLSRYDDTSTKDEEYAKQLITIHGQFVKRNSELTKLLSNYIVQRNTRVNTNAFFKKFLFWTFIVLLSLLTISIIVVFIKVDFSKTDIASVVSLLSISATYLASILSIFNIMSKYLFPTDEEKDAIGMISAVISNDLKVEEIMTHEIGSNHLFDLNELEKYKSLLDKAAITQEEYDSLKSNILSEYIKKN